MRDKKIGLIENFSGLTMANKLLLLLVFLGEKPAAEIILRACAEYPYKNTLKPKERLIPEIKELLNALGLSYCIRRIYCSGYVFLYVSRDPEIINGISGSLYPRDDEKFGRYMGFPETAIEAFLKKRPRLNEERNRKILESKLLFFVSFIFSEEFHLKELKEFSVRRYLAVRKHSPRLFWENSIFCKCYFGMM